MATGAKPIDPFPDARFGHPGSVGLPLVAALHRLEPRERAAVALAECSGFVVADVAAILGASAEWVESTLRRTRATLPAVPACAPCEALLVGQFQAALEAIEPERVAAILSPDATLGCTSRWAVYRGRELVARILCDRMGGERLRLVATRANGQPAFGCYACEPGSGPAPALGMLAFTVDGTEVTSLIRFWNNELLSYFGLPDALPDAGSPSGP
ncbi:MAG: sigma factor-like helix-turn-helix DNA-binding protein [Solirubrobacterales bacterium]